MAISQINNGDGTTTVRLDFTYPTQKLLDGANNATEFLYNRLTDAEKTAAGYPATFEGMSQAQKGALLFESVRETLHAWQRANIAAQEDAAKQAAIDSRAPDETFDA